MFHPEKKAADLGITLMPEDEAYAEMSKRLLAGWMMLGEHCPISGFPLLRKGEVTWSVRCNMEVKADGESQAPAPAPSPAPPSFSKPSSPHSFAPKGSPELAAASLFTQQVSLFAEAPETVADSGAESTVYDSDKISSELSRLLLKGWRMLEEECPISQACPLMQEKSTGRKYSCALGKFMDEPEPPAATTSAAETVEADLAEFDDDDDEEFLTAHRQRRMAELASSQQAAVSIAPAAAPAAAAEAAVQDIDGTVAGQAAAAVLNKLDRCDQLRLHTMAAASVTAA